jgi:dihydrodipicolinate synthase/N-acetylneuraminate lyase
MSLTRLHGIVPPLVTPLAGRERLDEAGFDRLIAHVLDGGVHGLFLLGTTGEGPSLSHRLQREVVSQGCRAAGGRVPVLVGVTDTSLEESLSLSQHSAECGATAVVLAPPHYFPMHQRDLGDYVRRFAEDSPLPVILYNMPSHTKTAFELSTVSALMHELPQVVGIKDSSGQMPYFQQLVQLSRQREDFTVLMGPEELLAAAVLMGGHGGVCGGANLLPQVYCELYQAAVAEDLREVHRLQQQVQRLSDRLYTVGEAPTAYLTGLKAALELTGICSGRLSEPLFDLPADRRARIAQHLRDLGIPLAATQPTR